MAVTPKRRWKTGLCDCCEDVNTCCYGFWCCPCLACDVSGKFNENQCLPLCDILTPAVCAACGIPLVVPPAAVSMRTSIRNKHGIQGSLCNDMLVSCFCVCCSWCQMHRELKKVAKTPTVVMAPQTQQPITVVNVQANPVMTANSNSAPPPVGYQNPLPGPAGYPNPPPVPVGYQNPPPGPAGYPNPPPGPVGYPNPPPGPAGYANPAVNPPLFQKPAQGPVAFNS